MESILYIGPGVSFLLSFSGFFCLIENDMLVFVIFSEGSYDPGPGLSLTLKTSLDLQF